MTGKRQRKSLALPVTEKHPSCKGDRVVVATKG